MAEYKQEPAWLIAKVDQRLAQMSQAMDTPEGRFALSLTDIVLTPLAEPPEGATPLEFERWDKTCDNCGKHCPTSLYTGHVMRLHLGTRVNLTFGVCPECKEIKA